MEYSELDDEIYKGSKLYELLLMILKMQIQFLPLSQLNHKLKKNYLGHNLDTREVSPWL